MSVDAPLFRVAPRLDHYEGRTSGAHKLLPIVTLLGLSGTRLFQSKTRLLNSHVRSSFGSNNFPSLRFSSQPLALPRNLFEWG